jgi:hypothetical protein
MKSTGRLVNNGMMARMHVDHSFAGRRQATDRDYILV